MTSLLLLLVIIFMFTLTIGGYLEKIRIPWIFASLIFGSLLAINNPFANVTESPQFIFLAQLGMYFLLFLIGLELNIPKLKKIEGFLFKSTFSIVFLEAILGSLVIHFAFHYNFLVSFFTAISFATVGEAILIPILDEFGIVNSSLGQTIIGIGTLDDIVEIALLIALSFVIHSQIESVFLTTGLSFSLLIILFLILRKWKFKHTSANGHAKTFMSAIFVFILLIFVGSFAKAEALGAILSGVIVRGILENSTDYLSKLQFTIKSITYGLFAPLFFTWVGASIDMAYLLSYPLLILLIVGVSSLAKIGGSLLVTRKTLGIKKATLLGIGLSVRFSTGIIVTKILLDRGIIASGLYSVVLASNIVFEFLIPFLFSTLLVKWHLAKEYLN